MTSFGPGGVHPASTPMDVMAAYLGVRELRGKPNRGPWIDECLRFVGLDPDAGPTGGYPWCAASLAWCCHMAGVQVPRTASVAKLADRLDGQGRRLEEPEPGCIFIHLRPNGTGHAGFWSHDLGGGVAMTLSGNTNADGSREGNAVGWATHGADYFTAFFHARRDEGAVG